MDEDACVGAIVCKLDLHKKMVRRGYIAMLAVDENYRRRGIGTQVFHNIGRAQVGTVCVHTEGALVEISMTVGHTHPWW